MGIRLAEILHQDHIITEINATGKRAALDEMVDTIVSRVKGLDRAAVLASLLEREKLGSTGIGHGVAIPHGKVKGLGGIMVFFGRSRRGVEFDSLDNLPVHLFFVIIAPEKAAAAHLKVLASISRLLKSQDFRLKLMKAGNELEIYRIILDADMSNAVA
jgi:PTS system nitrogen regulatory IIA component